MRQNAPDLFQRCVDLEANVHKRYSQMFLYGDKLLTELDVSQQRLDGFGEYQHCLCASG